MRTRISLALLLPLWTGVAHADMLLDTGPGRNSPIGYSVNGPNSPYSIALGGNTESLAGEFTTSQDWTINSVTGWMAANPGSFPPGPVDLNVSIYDNVPASANSAVDFGTQPGSAIFTASFSLDLCASAEQSSCPVGWQGAQGLSWNLSPGTYWVVFEGTGSDTGEAGLPGAVSVPLQNSLFLHGNQGWSELYPGGFGVEVTGTSPVPLPPTVWLLLSALGGVAVFARFGGRRHPASEGAAGRAPDHLLGP